VLACCGICGLWYFLCNFSTLAADFSGVLDVPWLICLVLRAQSLWFALSSEVAGVKVDTATDGEAIGTSEVEYEGIVDSP
jgi:hypothetical protein